MASSNKNKDKIMLLIFGSLTAFCLISAYVKISYTMRHWAVKDNLYSINSSFSLSPIYIAHAKFPDEFIFKIESYPNVNFIANIDRNYAEEGNFNNFKLGDSITIQITKNLMPELKKRSQIKDYNCFWDILKGLDTKYICVATISSKGVGYLSSRASNRYLIINKLIGATLLVICAGGIMFLLFKSVGK